MSKRLLVTGGSGDLGRVLAQRAEIAGFSVTSSYLSNPGRILAGMPVKLDMTDRHAVQEVLDAVKPDAIIHTALGMNIPNPRQQIVSAAYHLSTLAKGTRVIFLSTDMVFDGKNAPYADDVSPSPISAYGQAKAEMEMMADTVVRTSLIYDFKEGNKQIDWMLEKIKSGERIKLFYDEFRSPIWAANLADALIELVGSMVKGILNVANPEPMSRLALGTRLLEALGHDAASLVETGSQAGTGRQPNLTLDVHKAQMLLKTPLLTFEGARKQWDSEQGR